MLIEKKMEAIIISFFFFRLANIYDETIFETIEFQSRNQTSCNRFKNSTHYLRVRYQVS